MLIQQSANYQFFRPVEDEEITFDGTVRRLTAAKVALCKCVVIRFMGGDGKIRVSKPDASPTEGFDVFAGDTVFFSRQEAELLSGIRTGATNLVGWATYYA